jgi:hypothetical protein
MLHISRRSESTRRPFRHALAITCLILLVPGEGAALLAQQTTPAPAAPDQAKMLPPEQLDSLVAPIALYPDPLLAQTLAASTYPLEIVQLQQWLEKNPNLKDKALVDAVAKEPFDPSVQSMAAFPDVVKRLGDDIAWTTDLGNAFLAQQSDVMDAVQRMRKKAQDKGTLKSNEQQKIETQVIEKKEVIVIESAQPDVIYVPSYDPVVVYGAAPYPYYPYPSIYYPYYPWGGAFMAFGFGVAMGAFWGGVWGGCGWGNNTININNNNNFNRVEHHGDRGQGNRGDRGQGNRGDRGQGNRGQGGRGQGGGNWSHNPSHRGGAPYGDRATANKFGGNARGDSLASRQSGARQRNAQTAARGGPSVSNRAAGAGSRGGVSDRSAGAGSRGGGVSDRSAGSRGGGDFNRTGSSDRIGNRDMGGGGSRGGASGLGGRPSGGFSGSGARASSSRGSSSFGGSRGGGGRGGGGGRRR